MATVPARCGATSAKKTAPVRDPSRPGAGIGLGLPASAAGRSECYVGGARVQPQPGRFYAGWITPDVVGAFKGEPGRRAGSRIARARGRPQRRVKRRRSSAPAGRSPRLPAGSAPGARRRRSSPHRSCRRSRCRSAEPQTSPGRS